MNVNKRQMKTEIPKDLPKLDIPDNWVAGTHIGKDILNMYTNFPCRIKAGIFVLCLQGEIDVTIDTAHYHVTKNHFSIILPGCIMQILKVEGEVEIYFTGFSSQFIKDMNIIKPTLEIFYVAKTRSVIPLKENIASIFKDYLAVLAKGFASYGQQVNKEVVKHLLLTLIYTVGDIYKEVSTEKAFNGKSEKIASDFIRLVMQYYSKERNVSFYANKLGITQAHLSTTVRQVTGKTCVEIISSMVIMDAKAQLKSTDASIQSIAFSLNFTNMSFFGKYFKRHAGMGPQEYRNT